ncbi:alpha/beta fold hydrolase [Chromatiaceae bacterium AAb-1]|nr:alpha/beta fold hydrolase [Chromatiaceae bacterium AAb-1]
MLLHTHITGQGQPVVLLHGLFGSYENLGMIARSLSDNYQVINLDIRNHGRSGHSDNMDYPLMADDLAETLHHLNVMPYAILGHSMGGKITMQYAQQYPDTVEKIILADIAPVSYHSRHNKIFDGLSSVKLNELANRADADKQLAAHIPEAGVRQFLLKSLIKKNDTFQWRFNLPALIKNYPQLVLAPAAETPFTGPALFIKGSESDYILPEHKSVIMQRFPAAQAKVINGTGHWLHAEKPAAFTKIVQDFLLS